MNIAEQVIRAKQDLDDVYTAGQSSMVDESKLIPKTVSGSYISVDDVSEIPHSVGCKVERVNLLNPDNFQNGEFVEYDGVPCYKYTDNANHFIYDGVFKENTQYTFSLKLYTTNSGDQANVIIKYTDGTSYTIYARKGVEYVYTSLVGKTISRIQGSNSFHATVYIDLSFTQLNEGTEALPYAPYVSPESASVTRCGRNLLNPNNLGGGELVEFNGVPCYKCTEGGNPATNPTGLFIEGCFKPNTQYTLTTKSYREEGYSRVTQIDVRYTDGTASNSGHVAPGTLHTMTSVAGKTIRRIYYANYAGTTVYLDLSVSCLHEGTTAIPYEPYNGQTLTPSADGTVEGMTSVSPYMNIFSDTAGVNIEATYNKSYGMQTEYDRFWDAMQKNGKRLNYNYAFFSNAIADSAWNDDNFRPKYPIVPTSAISILQTTSVTGDITEKATFDFSKCINVLNAFYYATKITRLGVIDCRAVTEGHINFASNCYELETIDEIILQDNGTQFTSSTHWSFTRCDKLKNIKITGKTPSNVNVNFQYSPLTKASITSVVNALWEGASGKTLTLKLSAVNTAFETSTGAADGSTSAEFAALVATKTNWTITMI